MTNYILLIRRKKMTNSNTNTDSDSDRDYTVAELEAARSHLASRATFKDQQHKEISLQDALQKGAYICFNSAPDAEPDFYYADEVHDIITTSAFNHRRGERRI
jgi:hypothetical protein